MEDPLHGPHRIQRLSVTRMLRLPVLLTFILGLACAGCGASDAVSADEAPDRAANIAARTDELVRDVRESAKAFAQDPSARDDARASLEKRAQDAQELADRARDELPSGTAGREQLEQVNKRLADATSELINSDEPGVADLDGAESAINDAAAQLRGAVGDISAKDLPEAAQRQLDELRDQTP
jgi:hypothetical protein